MTKEYFIGYVPSRAKSIYLNPKGEQDHSSKGVVWFKAEEGKELSRLVSLIFEDLGDDKRPCTVYLDSTLPTDDLCGLSKRLTHRHKRPEKLGVWIPQKKNEKTK